MTKLTYFIGCVAVASVALLPAKASAGWGWWGGPGVSITIGPRYGYYGYGYRPYGYYGYPHGYGYRPYVTTVRTDTTVDITAIGRTGVATGGATTDVGTSSRGAILNSPRRPKPTPSPPQGLDLGAAK